MSTMPSSFEDLVNLPADHKIVIQDPRSSISGLALVLWVKAVYGDKAADYWTRLSPNILTVTSGWSEAYGLFTEGEADVVLSFNTSPSYHIVAEEDETKKAAILEEGHYPYFELVAKVSSTDVPNLADAFMDFVMSSEFQSIIPFTNWSYPAAQSSDEWPEVFANLPAPTKTVYFNEQQAAELRNSAVEEWRNALSK
jgi:thiamine transport system substrate-binding protein